MPDNYIRALILSIVLEVKKKKIDNTSGIVKAVLQVFIVYAYILCRRTHELLFYLFELFESLAAKDLQRL
jgi:Gpi18-like mannosyltransferase